MSRVLSFKPFNSDAFDAEVRVKEITEELQAITNDLDVYGQPDWNRLAALREEIAQLKRWLCKQQR